MVAPRGGTVIAHALLHHGPVAFVVYDKTVQVQLKAVLYGGIVHLGGQFAATDEVLGVKARAFAEPDEFVRGFARVPAFSATNVDSSSWLRGLMDFFNAPITEVVMPDECQSMPMTAPRL